MPTLHINAAHISISQAYHFIAICYQPDHSIPFLYKNLILRNIISTSVSRHSDNTQALHPCHNTTCFVTARLAVQLNRIIQNHSTCHNVATTHCIFPKPSSITLVCRNCILQVVKRCLFFIWCFFKKNCFVTPLFNTVGFAHIDYVRNAIGISMMYQSDKHIASCSYVTPWQSFEILLRQNPKASNLKLKYACAFFSMRCGFERKRQDFLKLFHV